MWSQYIYFIMTNAPVPSGLSVPSRNMFREYHHVKSPKTWAEAQKYCREVYTDLATVGNQHEVKRLQSSVQDNGRFAWIGLFDDISWKWTMGDADFNPNEDYSNWKINQPDHIDSKQSCVVMQYDGLWRDHDCETDRPFICYNGRMINVNMINMAHEVISRQFGVKHPTVRVFIYKWKTFRKSGNLSMSGCFNKLTRSKEVQCTSVQFGQNIFQIYFILI